VFVPSFQFIYSAIKYVVKTFLSRPCSLQLGTIPCTSPPACRTDRPAAPYLRRCAFWLALVRTTANNLCPITPVPCSLNARASLPRSPRPVNELYSKLSFGAEFSDGSQLTRPTRERERERESRVNSSPQPTIAAPSWSVGCRGRRAAAMSLRDADYN